MFVVAELVHERVDVGGERLLVVPARRLARVPCAAQVRRDDDVISLSAIDHRDPHVARLCVAMQQHDRGALARDQIVDRHPVRIEVPGRRRRRCGFRGASSGE